MKRFYLSMFLYSCINYCPAQTTPFFLRGSLKENRQQLYHNLVNNSIVKNLSLPLTDSTEENWQDAFQAMELINYKSAWTEFQIRSAFTNIQTRSNHFQRSLLELAYTNYPGIFVSAIKSLLLQTKDSRVFAISVLYILSGNVKEGEKKYLEDIAFQRLNELPGDPVLKLLLDHLRNTNFPITGLHSLFDKNYLPGNVLLISFQRKNRNYPGLVIVRDTAGNFIMDNNNLFYVPQLARSISNLPGYLTNGNTPEGIFRMDGFDTSKSMFIGPTTNIQLTLPFENNVYHFYKGLTLSDSGKLEDYKKLLPANLKNYSPLYETYYAGAAGRTEIIAHGTTIDPSYYKNKSFYPLTPTQGCLCTKEIWNDENGMLAESDQQKLIDAVTRAGGPDGYLIVVNIDDQQKAVEIKEISDLLQYSK